MWWLYDNVYLCREAGAAETSKRAYCHAFCRVLAAPPVVTNSPSLGHVNHNLRKKLERPPHFKRCVCTVRSGLSLLRGRQAACCVMMPRKQKPGEERREWQSSLVHIGASCISSRIKSRFAFLIFWWIEHRLTQWGLGFPFAAREVWLLERQISACLRSIVVIGSFLEGCDQ
jgi:hypothetical protein